MNFTVRKDGLFSCFFLRKADRLRSEIRCEAFLFAYENEYKEKFLGKDRFAWEMIFLAVLCALVFGSLFIAWIISK